MKANKFSNKIVYVDEKLSYSHCVSTTGSFTSATIRDLIDAKAQSMPDGLAFIFSNDHLEEDIKFNFRDLKLKSTILAQNLLRLGFSHGDRLAIAVDNSYEILIMFLAAASIGVVTVLFSQTFKLFEFEHLLKKTGAKGLFMFDAVGDKNFLDILYKISPELKESEKGKLNLSSLPDLRHLIVLNYDRKRETTYSGCWSYRELAESEMTGQQQQVTFPYVDPEDPLLIVYTSGTTGTPKGAVHRHFGMINNIYVNKTTDDTFGSGLIYSCAAYPMLHIGFPSTVISVLVEGHPFVFPFHEFNALEAIKACHKYKCQGLCGSPRMLNEIISHPDVDAYDLSALDFVFSVGSVASFSLAKRYHEKFSAGLFFNGYGMSEINSIATFMYNFFIPDIELDENTTPIGFPSPFLELKVLSKNNEILPLNQDGILHVRTYCAMISYWKEPEKTRECIDSNGWVNTGDLVSMDEKGCLYFKARLKETIKIYDGSIYPAEIESYLSKHPNVKESCVFGLKLDDYREAVCAWIQLIDKSIETTPEQIIQFCKQNFADAKCPKYIKIVDEFTDKTALGKLQRMIIANKFRQEINLP